MRTGERLHSLQDMRCLMPVRGLVRVEWKGAGQERLGPTGEAALLHLRTECRRYRLRRALGRLDRTGRQL